MYAGHGRWTFPDGSYFEGTYESGARTQGVFSSCDGKEEYNGRWAEVVVVVVVRCLIIRILHLSSLHAYVPVMELAGPPYQYPLCGR